jgi:hypothetical protein
MMLVTHLYKHWSTSLRKTEWRMEIMNEIGHRSDDFHGFKPATVATLAVLKRIEHLSELEEARLTYGCTCRRCINGFMSLRMRLFLTTKSRDLQDELRNISKSTKTGAEFLERARKYMKYDPHEAREARAPI